jgi:hypothetical protein
MKIFNFSESILIKPSIVLISAGLSDLISRLLGFSIEAIRDSTGLMR